MARLATGAGCPVRRYPVLVLDDVNDFLDPMYFNRGQTAIARVTCWLAPGRSMWPPAFAEIIARRIPSDPGTGDEGYNLDAYDIAGFGRPKCLVILPGRSRGPRS